ncbi:hypothetical protein RFI_04383 [Reticulomyxa filosa]|uniref:Exportin-2 central domain-containing protein n=1 Tax=Reticulomyxa filosa TaxID=46433 RepID=X6P3R8_RETFI|nr:hypothetical protein RFI_04383 [Reticulomyxa filosa]|eukprot:ETO32734.1 hypothetical protein RFI_04383 [Reticulomyxa filosa]
MKKKGIDNKSAGRLRLPRTLGQCIGATFVIVEEIIDHKESVSTAWDNAMSITGLPPDVRKNGMNIFLTLLGTILDMKGTQSKLVKDLLNPCLKDWINAMDEILDEMNLEWLDFQCVVVKSLHRLCKDYSLSITVSQMKSILPHLWKLMNYTYFYWKYCCIFSEIDIQQLSSKSCPPSFQSDIAIIKKKASKESGEEKDKDKEGGGDEEDALVNNMVRLLDLCYLFLSSLIGHKNNKWQNLIEEKLTDIIDLCIQLSMLTHDHIRLFEDDPEEFISAELDSFKAGDLRSSMKNALGHFLDLKPANDSGKSAYDSILVSAQRILKESITTEASYGWKLREAAIGAFELLADDAVDISELASTQLKFPIEEFIPNVLYKDIQSQNVHLQNRALWCLSHFVPLMGVQHQVSLLNSPIVHQCFTIKNCVIVRFAATRYIHIHTHTNIPNFFVVFQNNENVQFNELQSFLC